MSLLTPEPGDRPKHVVVTGMSLICALGSCLEESWEGLITGRDGIRVAANFAMQGQRSNLAAEVAASYPYKPGPRSWALVREAARQAIANAQLSPESLSVGGVCLGTSLGGWGYAEDLLLRETLPDIDPELDLGFPYFAPTSRLAADLKLSGPCQTISNACSAGTSAIGSAFESIRWGQTDLMIAGGYDVLTAMTYSGFHAIRAASTKGIKPFDRTRDGLILGEGAAILVLESLDHAVNRQAQIAAAVLGYGSSCDGYSMVRPDPTGSGAAAAMAQALNQAALTPQQVDFISAHGTATTYNDPMETAALKKVFGELAYGIPVHSIKGMIGHTLGAAGAIEAVVCCRIIQTGLIPPTIHLHNPDPLCDLDYVPNEARQATVRVALSNSSAFAGNNAALVFGAGTR